jgi:hypothetical protein
MHAEVEENRRNMPEEAISIKWLGIVGIVIALLMLWPPKHLTASDCST